MAKSDNIILNGVSGAIGRQLVIKQYGNRTVVTSYPDMSKVQWTAEQQQRRSVFSEAVAYAKSINSDPVKRSAFQKKLEKGRSVYHAAISEYMRLHKQDDTSAGKL